MNGINQNKCYNTAMIHNGEALKTDNILRGKWARYYIEFQKFSALNDNCREKHLQGPVMRDQLMQWIDAIYPQHKFLMALADGLGKGKLTQNQLQAIADNCRFMAGKIETKIMETYTLYGEDTPENKAISGNL